MLSMRELNKNITIYFDWFRKKYIFVTFMVTFCALDAGDFTGKSKHEVPCLDF